MPAQVSSEIRGLSVNIPTPRVVAVMFFLLWSPVRPGIDSQGTVGAGAGHCLNSLRLRPLGLEVEQ